MPENSNNIYAFSLPYQELIPEFLDSVWEAFYKHCSGESLTPGMVNRLFWEAPKEGEKKTTAKKKKITRTKRGHYPHLFTSREEGCSLRTEKSYQKERTRISDLVITTLKSAEERKSVTKGKVTGEFLPSPLKILLDYLTIPEEAASKAYAFMTLRLFLYEEMKLWPSGSDVPKGYTPFSQKDVVEELQVINTYWKGRDNIPVGGSPVKVLICHLLAMEGLMDLRFGTKGKRKIDPGKARKEYCEKKCLVPDDGYEFRVSERVRRLPEASEIINRLWGVSLPVRGANTLFFGGLRFSESGGLVVAVSGAPGTGKTSIALGLAAVLSPLGAMTFYITAEESENDLLNRLAMVTPEYLGKIVPKTSESVSSNNFYCKRLPPDTGEGGASGEVLHGILTEIKSVLSKSKKDSETNGFPLPCPLMVVIDGLQVYLGQDRSSREGSEYTLYRFIQDCRDLNVLVILTSGVQLSSLPKLEYLVDVVMRLDYRDTEKLEEKPLRILELIKTRHQISRPGTHVFHISGEEGLKISPQLPSLLDTKAIYEVLLPDQECRTDVFNRYFRLSAGADINCGIANEKSVETLAEPFLYTFPRSHILVHGKGSAGKSGFGLKLLMAPFFREGNYEGDSCARPRILIISFLYPADYYEKIWNLLTSLRSIEYAEYDGLHDRKNKLTSKDYEILHFYPGYLNPEDMASKIMQRLDGAELEGAPFTGVMFDGIHNVFLQFPRLESREMIWPMIYDLLRRRDLTVVTTHTNITVHESDDPNEDYDLNIRKAKPLLHAILQGADFFIGLNEETGSNDCHEKKGEPASDEEGCYAIRVHMAQGQPRPPGKMLWNREKLMICAADRKGA